MSKYYFLSDLCRKCGFKTIEEAEKVAKAFTEIVTEHLKQGYSVELWGFGKFTTQLRKVFYGKVPYTKEDMNNYTMRSIAKFKIGSRLKRELHNHNLKQK